MAYITTDSVSGILFNIGSPVKTVTLWLAAARERRALNRLSASQLDDLGINAKEAKAEARRPFWDVAPRR